MFHSHLESRGYLKLPDVWKVHGKVFHLESRNEAKCRNVFHPRKLAIVDFFHLSIVYDFLDFFAPETYRRERVKFSLEKLGKRQSRKHWTGVGTIRFRATWIFIFSCFHFSPAGSISSWFGKAVMGKFIEKLLALELAQSKFSWKIFPSRWKSFVRIRKALRNDEFSWCFLASQQANSFNFRARQLSSWTFLKKHENLKFFTSASRHSNFHFLSTITIWLARAEIGKFWKLHFHLVGKFQMEELSRVHKLFMTFTNFSLWSNYKVVWSLMKLESSETENENIKSYR